MNRSSTYHILAHVIDMESFILIDISRRNLTIRHIEILPKPQSCLNLVIVTEW